MIKNIIFNEVRRKLEEIKDQRDDLAIKNINLERENTKLIAKLNKLENEIKTTKEVINILLFFKEEKI